MWPHLAEVASVLTVKSLFRTATRTLPGALRSWSAFRAATRWGPFLIRRPSRPVHAADLLQDGLWQNI